jgi:small basic protein (TIGR04137 family)
MSLDASLKAANALVRHRNVLTRDERLKQLKDEEKWQEGRSILGLPKVGHRKMVVAGKAEAKEEAEGAAAGAPAAAAPAAGAKGAASGAGKAPAAGKAAAAAPAAKAAAPSAKKK